METVKLNSEQRSFIISRSKQLEELKTNIADLVYSVHKLELKKTEILNNLLRQEGQLSEIITDYAKQEGITDLNANWVFDIESGEFRKRV